MDSFRLSKDNSLSVGEVSFIIPDGDHSYRNNDIPITTASLHDSAIVWKYKFVRPTDKADEDPGNNNSHLLNKTGNEINYYRSRLKDGMSVQDAVVLDMTLSDFVKHLSRNQMTSRQSKTDNKESSLFFSFPVGAIRCLNRIKKMSVHNEFLLLAADKANAT